MECKISSIIFYAEMIRMIKCLSNHDVNCSKKSNIRKVENSKFHTIFIQQALNT